MVGGPAPIIGGHITTIDGQSSPVIRDIRRWDMARPRLNTLFEQTWRFCVGFWERVEVDMRNERIGASFHGNHLPRYQEVRILRYSSR